MKQAFGAERKMAICREMTKTYEETVRGTIDEIISWANSKEVLGELTIVIEGFDPESRIFQNEELITMVLARESAGETRKDAIAAVAKEVGVAKREIFDLMVSLKEGKISQ